MRRRKRFLKFANLTKPSWPFHDALIWSVHYGLMIDATASIGRRAGSLVRTNFSFRNRGLLGAVILGPLAFVATFSPPHVTEGQPLAWMLNGGAWIFFLLYVAIRVWATLFIGGNKDLRLQTDGPYSVCRNPLYVGSFCFALAVSCMLKSTVFAAGVVLTFIVYLNFVVRAEEHFLGLRFGEDFANYCRRTPRFWPRWSLLHAPALLRVDLKRLKQECVRLSRAALIPILLEVLMRFRSNPGWPHWFHLP